MSYDPRSSRNMEFVRKDQVRVLIQTTSAMIQGFIYLRPGRRVVDELNHGDVYLAVTEARVFDSNGEVLQGSHFLTVNRAHIVWVRPDEEPPMSQQSPGTY
jgi:hypothetical protein